MRKVLKYRLDEGRNRLALPGGSSVVLVGSQKIFKASPYSHDEIKIVIWCEVETEKDCEPRKFNVYATGQQIDAGDVHVGSTIIENGEVWHVYEAAGG